MFVVFVLIKGVPLRLVAWLCAMVQHASPWRLPSGESVPAMHPQQQPLARIHAPTPRLTV